MCVLQHIMMWRMPCHVRSCLMSHAQPLSLAPAPPKGIPLLHSPIVADLEHHRQRGHQRKAQRHVQQGERHGDLR